MSQHAPTQVRRPWRATVRTALAVVIALAAMLPALVDAAGIDQAWPPAAAALAIAAAITRVMALPSVEGFLERFVPWLAADPNPPSGPGDGGWLAINAAAVVLGVLVVLVVAGSLVSEVLLR